tara:strand:+ start:75 stop:440 length:366 start_codon:yes stop_codon:yes gene_type:complete
MKRRLNYERVREELEDFDRDDTILSKCILELVVKSQKDGGLSKEVIASRVRPRAVQEFEGDAITLDDRINYLTDYLTNLGLLKVKDVSVGKKGRSQRYSVVEDYVSVEEGLKEKHRNEYVD